jgi:LacI family transcriptional regulator
LLFCLPYYYHRHKRRSLKKKASIHDIARQLKVSATTVSFVLNGKAEEKRISSDLEKRIMKYVRETGYQPNHVAKSLRTGKSKIIGMLVEDISDPFFSSIARVIEGNAYKLGYKIFYSSTENDGEKTRALIKVLRERQVDGYIIAPPPGIEEEVKSLMNDNLPVILFDRYFLSLETTNVIVDNFGGSHAAIKHFLENGYKNIAFVTLDSSQTQMHDRLKGYIKAIAGNKLKQCVCKIPYAMKQDKIVEAIRLFLEKHPEIDAVLFGTNYLAVSGLEALHQLGLKIPSDVAVIGFDDNTHFSLFSPAITAVAQPVQEISETVIKKLIARLSGKEKLAEKGTIVLPVKLIVRESSLPRRKK